MADREYERGTGGKYGEKEFDPSSERHFAQMIIKLVEPGCTSELQIEECWTGRVTRISTSGDYEADEKAMTAAVMAAWNRVKGEIL